MVRVEMFEQNTSGGWRSSTFGSTAVTTAVTTAVNTAYEAPSYHNAFTIYIFNKPRT